jgi:hypothetical protein
MTATDFFVASIRTIPRETCNNNEILTTDGEPKIFEVQTVRLRVIILHTHNLCIEFYAIWCQS